MGAVNAWRLGIIAVLLTGGSLLARPSPAKQECRKGQVTHFAANQCVNVWPPEGTRFRWPDLQASCDPASMDCDSAFNAWAEGLSISDCKDVRILKVIGRDHLARIRCEKGDGVPGPEFLINLDSLACHADNVFEYGSGGKDPESAASGISGFLGAIIVSRAEALAGEIRKAATVDTRVLLSLVQESKPDVFFVRMMEAQTEINVLLNRVRARQLLGPLCEPVDRKEVHAGPAVRAMRACRLLKSSSDVSVRLFGAAQNDAETMSSGASGYWQSVALQKEVYRLMSIDAQEHQADTLAMRMLVFYALKKDHPDLPGKLKLIRKSVETGVTDPFDGDQPFFWELHAGFIFGGRRLESNSGGGYDCSDFMASLLAEKGSGTESLSTGFLKDIARRLAKEKGSRKLSKEEGALASCFAAVDLRAGESPQPGDFVISKNDTLEDGHVAIVKEVTEDGSIRTIEAAGAANAIVSKTRPLYEPMPACPEQEDQLPVRPDLFVLRLKGKPPRTCPLS